LHETPCSGGAVADDANATHAKNGQT